MIETSFLQQIAGGKGSKYFDSTEVVNGLKFSSLVIQEDSVIETALDSKGLDLVTYWGVSGKTLKSGAFLTVPINSYIVSLKMTSGAVIGYNA